MLPLPMKTIRCCSGIRAAWNDILKAAERDNAPGSFTAFIGFELMDIANIAASRPKDKSMLATE